MFKALTVTAVKMAHTIWTLQINRDVCTVLAMVEQSVVSQPMDLLHRPLQVNLSMKQVRINYLSSGGSRPEVPKIFSCYCFLVQCPDMLHVKITF